MKKSVQRLIADWLCSVLRAVLPAHLKVWAEALRAEISSIAQDGQALGFALQSFCGLLPRALIARWQGAFLSISATFRSSGDTSTMKTFLEPVRAPPITGVACAIAATLLGLSYMSAAGAPLAYLVMNFSALVIGVSLLYLAAKLLRGARRAIGPAILVMALGLLATALFGRSVEGAARWIAFGPLFIQSSLLVLPVMIVSFARTRTVCATMGMCIAAFALALQPDRAMAGVLTAGLAALAMCRFDRAAGVALASSLIAFVFTLTQPDTLPAVPYVDQILFSAFDVHLLAGVAVIAGAAMLLVPAVTGWRAGAAERTAGLAFGAVWLAIILAAALGNYPTPVVGYGSSAIIGYLLSLLALPSLASHTPETAAEAERTHDRKRKTGFLRATTLSAIGIAMSGAATGQTRGDDCERSPVAKVERPDTVWQPGPGGEQIALWPESVDLQLPDYDGNPEMTGTGSPLIAGRTWSWATYISRPTMTIYAPKADNTGAALLVLPGGGYAAVAMDLEGTEICEWITAQGVTCIILKYRAPQVWRRDARGVGVPPEHVFALEDAQRAMGLLRANAASHNINPEKIGVIGFSAGAHLAAALSNADERAYKRVDAVDDTPTRPDFAIVLYPGRFLPQRHPGADLSLAPWVAISAQAPPTLLIHAMNDPTNDVRHSMAYGLALDDAGVSVDMRFFARGCHAFGVRPTSDPITTEWPGDAVQWLHDIGMF